MANATGNAVLRAASSYCRMDCLEQIRRILRNGRDQGSSRWRLVCPSVSDPDAESGAGQGPDRAARGRDADRQIRRGGPPAGLARPDQRTSRVRQRRNDRLNRVERRPQSALEVVPPGQEPR